jgi:hypothetical protein
MFSSHQAIRNAEIIFERLVDAKHLGLDKIVLNT